MASVEPTVCVDEAMKLKSRNRFFAAWMIYRVLRRMAHFNRLTCFRLAMIHFFTRKPANLDAQAGKG